jgi:hypothetical protein
MKLWWITKKQAYHCGPVNGILVRAESEQEAFKVVITHPSVVKYGDKEVAIWCDPDQTTCKELPMDGPPAALWVDCGDS